MGVFVLSHASIKSGDGLICMSFNHMMTEVCFADVPGLHRLYDRLPNCEAVHDLLSDEENFRTGEHRVCRDCYQIIFSV